MAARHGQVDIIELLKNKGVDLSAVDDYGQTPLHIAARNNHGAAIKLLLNSSKADGNSQDTDGQTPFGYAAWAGHFDAVHLAMGEN